MFTHEILLNRFNRSYLDRLMLNLPDDELDIQPHPGLHSPRWILAHLAIVADYGLKMIDLPTLCPKTWHVAYGPSSQAGTESRVKPDRSELRNAIDVGYSQLCDALPTASTEKFNEPHGVELLAGTLIVTRIDLVCHILTTHFATHLGQLSSICRLQGRPALF